jgi:hypothetical protein
LVAVLGLNTAVEKRLSLMLVKSERENVYQTNQESIFVKGIGLATLFSNVQKVEFVIR